MLGLGGGFCVGARDNSFDRPDDTSTLTVYQAQAIEIRIDRSPEIAAMKDAVRIVKIEPALSDGGGVCVVTIRVDPESAIWRT